MEGILHRVGTDPSRIPSRRSQSKSPASARSAARAATPTATSTSAAASRCGRSATTKARSSSTGSCELIDEHKPLHVSIVGGEPLVRFRELNEILPRLAERGIYTQVVTSAVRPIPSEWASHPAAADRRLDRRPAARARRAPQAGHLRSHPEAHRRTPDHRALHRHPAAGAARRLPRGVRRLLVGEPERPADLGQPLHAADRRSVAGAAPSRRTASASSPR